jgi:hypothetical protein
MRFPGRALGLGTACAAAVVACTVPTDKSQDIQVAVRPSDSLEVRGIIGAGDRDSLSAEAYRLTAAGDTVWLPNVDLAWSSSDPAIATVTAGVNPWAQVVGINPGYVTISAQPVAFAQVSAGTTRVRIAGVFAVDSVRPQAMRYGEKVTVYGVGIHLPFFWSLGGGDLIEDPDGFHGNFNGLEQRVFWIPPPAETDSLFYVGSGVGGFVGGVLTVDPHDILEPDTLSPFVIDVNGPGVLHQQISPLPVLFFNPALAFEPVTSGLNDIEWVRLDQGDTASGSIVVHSTVSGDTAFAFVSDSLYKCLPGPDGICYNLGSGWFFTPGRQGCNGASYAYPTQPRVPTFVASFRKWPAPHVHLAQFYSRQGRYELTVVRGYLRGRAFIPPDRFEDNALCFQADSNFFDSTGTAPRQIVVGLGTSYGDSSLTISTPYDVDVYRFRVNGSALPSDTVLTIQTKSRLQAGVDPSDIDVYLYDTAGGFIGSSTRIGSSESLTARVLAGEYYAFVVDIAGQPTVYSMCLARGTACTPPGAAAPSRVTARPHIWKPGAAVAPTAAPHDPRVLLPRP